MIDNGKLTSTANRLLKTFSLYNDDINYYKSLLEKPFSEEMKNPYSYVKDIILDEMNINWQVEECNWLINSLNKMPSINNSNLKYILSNLANWNLEISINILNKLLQKCSVLDSFLSDLVNKNKKENKIDIDKITNDEHFQNLILAYASIKNIEVNDLEEEVDLEVEINSSTDDAVKMYLREVGSNPVLSRDDCFSCFKNIDECKEMLENESLSKEEKKKIEKKIEFYRQKILDGNLRLVVSIAKRYVGRGVLFLDLIQEGNIGLMNAYEKFEYKKGYAFSTYATWWIRQAVTRSVANDSRTIRIPVHLHEKIGKLVRTIEVLKGKLGRDPSTSEIAKEFGIPEEKVEELLIISQKVVELDAPVGHDDDSDEMGYFIAADGKGVEEEILDSDLRFALTNAMSILSEKEEFILRMRYGVQDPNNPNPLFDEDHTLEEVGSHYKITRERIRQIEEKALRKMRNSRISKRELTGYSGESQSQEYVKGKNVSLSQLLDVNIYSEDKEKVERMFNELLKRCNPRLTDYEEQIVRMIYGIQKPDSHSTLFEHPMNVLDITKVLGRSSSSINAVKNNALKKLMTTKNKERGGNGMELKYFDDYFSEKNRNLARQKIEFLTDIQQKALKQYFGKKLDKIVMCDSSMKNIAIGAVYKIQKMIDDPTYVPKDPNVRPATGNSPVKIIRPADTHKQYNGKSLEEILNCSFDEFIKVINGINPKSKDYHLLTRLFGEDFKTKFNLDILNPSELSDYNRLLKKLRNILQNIRVAKEESLLSLLKCTKDELDKLIEIYGINSFNVMKKVHGENLDEKGSYYILSYQDRSIYNENIERFKKMIDNIRKNSEVGEFIDKTLLEILSCTDEEFNILMNKMNIIPFNLKLLALIHGDDYKGVFKGENLSSQNIQFYKHLITNLKEKANELKNDKPILLKTRFNKIAWNECLEIIQNSKECAILLELFGNDLETIVYPTFLSEEQKLSIEEAIEFVKNEAKSKKDAESTNLGSELTLKQILNCTDEELTYLKQITKFSDEYKDIFLMVFGEDFKKVIDLKSLTQKEKKNVHNMFRTFEERLIKYRNEKDKTLQEIIDCTDEEFIIFKNIIYKNKKHYEFLSSIFGINLDQSKDSSKLNSTNIKFYSRVITVYVDKKGKVNNNSKETNSGKVKKSEIKDNQIQGLTLKQILNCTDEELSYLRQVTKFTDNYKECILKVFGEKWDNVLDLDLLSFLEKKRIYTYVDKFENRLVVYRAEKDKTLQEIIDCTDKQMKDMKFIVSKNKALKDLLYPIFGESLDNKKDSSKLNSNNIRYYMSVINKYSKKQNWQESDEINLKSIYQILDCTNEELQYALRITKSSSQLVKTLKRLFGEDYNDVYDEETLKKNKTNRTAIKNILEKINEFRRENGKTLQEILECDNEEYKRFLAVIKKAMNLTLFQQIFGQNLDKEKNSAVLNLENIKTYNSSITHAKKILTDLRNNLIDENEYTIYQFLNCTEEELSYILRIFKPSSNALTLLKKLFGEDCKDNYGGILLERRDKSTISYILDRIEEFRKENGKTLQEIINCDDEEYKLFLIAINKSRCLPIFKEVFGKYLGKGKDSSVLNSENIKSYNYSITTSKKLLDNIRNSSSVDNERNKKGSTDEKLGEALSNKAEAKEVLEPEILLQHEGKVVQNSGFNIDFFRKIVKIMPVEYRMVMELYLGIYDINGICYSSAQIATLFNTDELDIKTRIEKGKLLFKKIADEYKNIFEIDFPLEIEGNYPQLLREK